MTETWEEDERARRERSHQEAVAAAKRGKAILSPDHINRQFVFVIVGGLLFAALVTAFLALSLGLRPGALLSALVIPSFLLGASAGFYYFHKTHVIDESLETSIFDHFNH